MYHNSWNLYWPVLLHPMGILKDVPSFLYDGILESYLAADSWYGLANNLSLYSLKG
jgi:hypothetical protein